MVLSIFPAQALDSSVITTVWVGLCVVTMLNLRFGTTLAGLVVPGYLVPLLLMKPLSAVVIWGEAITTYLLARWLADALMRATGSCTMFGRDRFFALLLTSVFVRASFDGWLLPALGRELAAQGLAFDYHNNLHSFGLVIVALTANQMWNSGFVRGAGTFLLYVGLTWFVVRWLLIPFTNFDIAGLGFVYESVASDILASPKAYIILLTTAFVASRLNLHYGWEFSGILIPSLLALQWFQPTKLLVSILEAILILLMGRAVLALPFLRRINVEGSRLLLLLTTIGFVYKLLLGYFLTWAFPSVKPSDYFALGYLLSTLLAAKMYQKQITLQMARGTVQTSLMGLLVATVVGFGLQRFWPAEPLPPQAPVAVANIGSGASLVDRLSEARRAFHASESGADPLAFSTSTLQDFDDGIRSLVEYAKKPEPVLFEAGARRLARAGFVVERLDQWLIIRDRDSRRGSGVFALNLAPATATLVAVPFPLDEPGSFEAGIHLAERQAHAAFASAGTRRDRLPENASNAVRNIGLPFARFHALAGSAGVLHIRGRSTTPGEDPPADLWIQRSVPPGLDVERLRGLAGALQIQFGRRDTDNRLRDSLRQPFAELLLGRPARLRLVARSFGLGGIRVATQQQRVDGYLHDWLMRRREAIAAAGSDRYTPPALGDLLYLQSEVVEPLFAVASRWGDERDLDALSAIDAMASRVGYRVILHRHARSGEEHAVLAESPGGRRYWGTVVLRLGEASPYVVAIPRPIEERFTFEYGARLFARLEARGLVISGAHQAARADGLANVLEPGNPRTLFNAAYQSLLWSMQPGGWALQVRGRREEEMHARSDVVATFVGRPPESWEQERVDALVASLGGTSERVAIGGSMEQSPRLEVGGDVLSAFLRRLPNARMIVLSVSPAMRQAYRDILVTDARVGRFDAAGVPTRKIDVVARIAADGFGPPPDTNTIALIDAFVRSDNVAALAAARQQVPVLERLIDLGSGRAFLRMSTAAGEVMAWRSLEAEMKGRTEPDNPDARLAFIDGQGAWLMRGDGQ